MHGYYRVILLDLDAGLWLRRHGLPVQRWHQGKQSCRNPDRWNGKLGQRANLRHDANFAQTGIKVIPGSNGASLYARNIILEGDFAHNCSPAVWFTGFSSAMDAVLDNVQGNVDCGRSSMPSIQNDGLLFNQGGGGPTVLNSGASVTGSMTILNAYPLPASQLEPVHCGVGRTM